MEGRAFFVRAIWTVFSPFLISTTYRYLFRGQDVQFASTLPKIMQQPQNGAPGSPVETFSRCSSTIIINDYATKTPPWVIAPRFLISMLYQGTKPWIFRSTRNTKLPGERYGSVKVGTRSQNSFYRTRSQRIRNKWQKWHRYLKWLETQT